MKRPKYQSGNLIVLCSILTMAIATVVVLMPMVATTQPAAAEALLASESNPTAINVLAQSDLELTVEFVDAVGQSVTLDFVRQDTDSPWFASQPIQSERDIVFGHTSPRLPTLTALRGRGIDPAFVVQPFQPDFFAGPMDDLTIYQLDNRQFAIGVHSDGMIVSIGYVGYLAHLTFRADPWQNICTILKNSCCNNKDNTSCRNVIRYCPAMKEDTCECIAANCQSDPPHIPSCNQWMECCEGNECDLPAEPEVEMSSVDRLEQTTLDLLQYHLDTP